MLWALLFELELLILHVAYLKILFPVVLAQTSLVPGQPGLTLVKNQLYIIYVKAGSWLKHSFVSEASLDNRKTVSYVI